MRTKPRRNRQMMLLSVCLVGSLAAMRLRDEALVSARTLVLDTAAPLVTIRQSVDHFLEVRFVSENNRLQAELDRAAAERDAWQARVRAEELARAELIERIATERQLGPTPFPEVTPSSWIDFDLVTASLLGREELRLISRNLLIVPEGDERVTPGSLVLRESTEIALLIDRGTADDLIPELPVYAGRSVLGRILEVGERISRIQRVTDVEYRGHAQILRRTEDRFTHGPEGILEGTGDGTCRLRYIGKTESVQVGDEIYTGTRSTALPFPMYYGKVVEARLEPADREWYVVVEPVDVPTSLRAVQILRGTIPSNQVLAN